MGIADWNANCSAGTLPRYQWDIDWALNGTFISTVQTDLIASTSTVVASFGRDQKRQFSPAKLGSAAFSLNNLARKYSPENVNSPLWGNLDASRPMRGQVTFNGVTYPLFYGVINDYTVNADRGNRTVVFSFLDSQFLFQNNKISTALYSGIRTGTAISTVLTAAGWTGATDLDPGDTVMPWWWLSLTTASQAISDLVKSEGPPAVAYVAPNGTFTFRGRHHRMLRTQSTTSQATFGEPRMFDCAAPAVTGFHFTDPFTYNHGSRDIINSAQFSVGQRAPSGTQSVVWNSTLTYLVSNNTTLTVTVSANDACLGAVAPVNGTDYTTTGGTVTATLDKTSGQTFTISLSATGGDTVVSGLQLRAFLVPVVNTVVVLQQDSDSIKEHGEQDYPDTVPWAGLEDANAIASTIVLRYAQRRPTVDIRVSAQDPSHFVQVVNRTISDRITIQNDEIGLNAPFFIEHVDHTIQRMNQSGLPPVHAAVFGCEEELVLTANAFQFDTSGHGFDQGAFSPPIADNAATVFTFDSATNGLFDTNLFAT